MRKENKQGQADKVESPAPTLPEPELKTLDVMDCARCEMDLPPVQVDLDIWAQIDIPTWRMEEIAWTF